MESLRDIRRNIKSFRATRQIMRTMKMVASARMKKAQNGIISARPFAARMEEMLSEVSGHLAAAEGAMRGFCGEADLSRPAGLVVITSDKGLCGSFNVNAVRAALEWLGENRGRGAQLFLIGKKGRDYLRRLSMPGVSVAYENTGIFPKAGYVHAELLGRAALAAVSSGAVSELHVIYNEFVSLAAQRAVIKRLLPLDCAASRAKGFRDDFIFEPGRAAMLEALLPRHVKAQLYRCLLESQAAELAARMNAMDAADKNAGELIDDLALKLNRTRQAMITREISEIVGGAEALSN
ncbi:MAG: ATP synthase F1 subunit gamma [Elusimicrobiales bacterium]